MPIRHDPRTGRFAPNGGRRHNEVKDRGWSRGSAAWKDAPVRTGDDNGAADAAPVPPASPAAAAGGRAGARDAAVARRVQRATSEPAGGDQAPAGSGRAGGDGKDTKRRSPRGKARTNGDQKHAGAAKKKSKAKAQAARRKKAKKVKQAAASVAKGADRRADKGAKRVIGRALGFLGAAAKKAI